MKQVVQSISGGPVRVVDVPTPSIDATEVLVQTVASVISAGTEGAVVSLAQSSLLAKARARPDLVRQVVKRARVEGVAPAARAVRSRLAGDLPLGYSASGVVLEVGEAVAGIRPGQLVATAGAGSANHAEFQAVPGLLCAPVPDGVAADDAAFATIASIALHGFRLAEVGPGSKVAVVGMGLLGQLAIRLARAAGCSVAGIDISDFAVQQGQASGALSLKDAGDDTTATVLDWSRGRGADAVLITAAAKDSSVIRRTPALCRDRATVVVVGDTGLELDRTPLYEKELTVRVARSYGPGRYERSYEDWAVDYPAGFVRWTEGRNLEAVLDLLAGQQLAVGDLVTHRFPIEGAAAAYELIEKRSEPFLAIAIDYPAEARREPAIRLGSVRSDSPTAEPGIGLIGAGAFASGVLVPALKAGGFTRLVSVASASGLSAVRLAERAGFEKAVSGAETIIDDPDIDVVVIATPHDTHASLATRALRAGKHVFCEKPLALTMDELDEVEAAWRTSGKTLFVGFNRRHSAPVATVSEYFGDGTGPLAITYRVNAGAVPPTHWYHDRRQGGRLLGEVCHFIDTCSAIAGGEPLRVHASACGLGDIVVQLEYAAAVASIIYATGGPPSLEKERIEILGHGRIATVQDFRSVQLDGRTISFKGQDKGHRQQIIAFREALDGPPVAVGIESMRATLAAAASVAGSPAITEAGELPTSR